MAKKVKKPKNIRVRNKGVRKPVVLAPPPGTKSYIKTRVYRFVPLPDTEPERIERFVKYCIDGQANPVRKELSNGKVFYDVLVKDTTKVSNVLHSSANRYGLDIDMLKFSE